MAPKIHPESDPCHKHSHSKDHCQEHIHKNGKQEVEQKVIININFPLGGTGFTGMTGTTGMTGSVELEVPNFIFNIDQINQQGNDNEINFRSGSKNRFKNY